MKRAITLAAFVMILHVAAVARANPSVWARVGTGCVAYDATTASYAPITSWGALMANTSGKLAIAICPITTALPGCPGLGGGYSWNYSIYATSSNSTYGGITPYLLRIAKSTGAQSYVLNPTTYRASATYGAPKTYSISESLLDFANYFYWAEIYLDGTGAQPSVQSLYAVELVCIEG